MPQAVLDDPAAQQVFLQVLEITGSPTAASRAIDLNRSNSRRYKNREGNEKFSEKWDDAVESFLDHLEMTMAERAIDGVTEDVYFQGEVVGTVKKYSDTNAQFLLRGRRSKVFREKTDLNIVGLATLEERLNRANARLSKVRKPRELEAPDPEKFNIIETEFEEIECPI